MDILDEREWEQQEERILYKKMEAEDIPQYVLLRIQQLQEEGQEFNEEIVPALHAYYEKHIEEEDFTAWLALVEGEVIATSGISFVERPPHFANPLGRVGILSGMYTIPPYRRRGIAKTLLGMVVDEARERGCTEVQITASEMGASLYEQFGFVARERCLEYTFVKEEVE